MTDSSSHTVLITGVSSGLGYGLASEFLKEGARVYGISRRRPDLEHSSFHFLQLDLTDDQAVRNEVGPFLSGIPSVDYTILNAGILGDVSDLVDSDLNQMKEVMEVNVWANKVLIDVLLGLPLSFPMVVAISSGASVSGSRGWSGYGISKAALNMMVALYAAEAPKTHFISLAPGLIQTAMQDVIQQVSDPGRFPTVQRLKEARGTPEMPLPQEAARRIIEVLPRLRNFPTGSFQDIRKI